MIDTGKHKPGQKLAAIQTTKDENKSVKRQWTEQYDWKKKGWISVWAGKIVSTINNKQDLPMDKHKIKEKLEHIALKIKQIGYHSKIYCWIVVYRAKSMATQCLQMKTI